MNRTVKITIFVVATIVAAVIGFVLYQNELTSYALIAAAVALVLIISTVTYAMNTRNEETIYNSTLKKVLNNYDAILVESHNFPDLKGKNIIKVTNMDDLVDAQIEIRKPIYYMIEGEDSCSFVLLDNSEACIYILKQNENVTSPLELIVNEYEKHNDIDASLLEDIERTTIIKLNNMKSFKVSPYRKNKDTETKEEENKSDSIEAIKEKIEKDEYKKEQPEKKVKKQPEIIEIKEEQPKKTEEKKEEIEVL